MKKKYKLLWLILIIVVSIMLIGIYMKVNRSTTDKFINIIKNNKEDRLTQAKLDEYKSKIQEEFDRAKSTQEKTEGMYSRGAIEYLNGDYREAIKYFKLAEEVGIEKAEANYKLNMMIYSGLSSSYISLGRVEESEKYFSKAMDIALSKNMTQELGELYYARGKAMMLLQDKDREVVDLLKAAEKYLKKPKSQVWNKLMLSKVYKLNGEGDLSLKYADEALNQALNINDKVLVERAVINLGENYYIKEKYLKAISIYEDFLQLNEVKDTTNKLIVYGYLLECYAAENDYISYSKYKNKYIELAEKLETNEKNEELLWLYVSCANIELEYSNIMFSKMYLEKAKDLIVNMVDELHYSTNLWIKCIEIKIDYVENKDYIKTYKLLESFLNEDDYVTIQIDLKNEILNKILKLSYENEDFDTFIRYNKIMEDEHEKEVFEMNTDKVFFKIDEYIENEKIVKAKNRNIVLMIIVLLMIYLLVSISKKQNKIKRLYSELEESSRKDPLTKVYNKGYLNEVLQNLFLDDEIVTIIMIDIDHFKNYNDNYGHISGDSALIEVANCISEVFEYEQVFRFGGEEFSVIALMDEECIVHKLETLIKEIYNRNIKHKYSDVSDRITLSIGVSSGEVNNKEDVEELLKKADENLYKSKEKGRNRYTL